MKPAMLGAWAALAMLLPAAAPAAEPIKIGFTSEQTGPLAIAGKQWLLSAKIWLDDVNAKGGLLGRPVQLVYYDDQSNPSLVPGIYSKLFDIDHVDLVVLQGTNMSTPAMPSIIEHHMVAMTGFALAVSQRFHYDRYFQTMPYGPDGKDSITHGFFEAAMTLQPKPKTIALVGADSDFAQAALDGARASAKRLGLDIVYDRKYPPTTTDYAPIIQSLKAAKPEIICVGAYAADAVGILRAAAEVGISARLFGGAMVGPQIGTLKAQLGEQLNGIVTFDLYVPEPTMNFPGIREFLAKYQALAPAAGTDPLGFYFPPFSYVTFEILGQAVNGAGTLDQGKIADYLHKTTFHTIVGDVKFGPDGEWATPRMLTVQYRNIHGNDINQFKQPGIQTILYPPQFATGKVIEGFHR